MNKDRKIWLSSGYRDGGHYWPLMLFVSAAWFYVAAVTYGKNWFGVYQPRILLACVLIIPLFYVGLSAAFGGFILPRLKEISGKKIITFLGFAIVMAAFLTLLFPPPEPALNKPHTLRLVSSGEMNPDSRGTKIEVEGIRTIDGTPILLERLRLNGDWKLSGGRLVSSGEQPASIAEFTGEIPAGVDIRMRYLPKAGKLGVQFDGEQQEIDLYSSWEVGGNIVVKHSPWIGYSLIEKILSVLAKAIYFLGITFLALALILVIELRVLPAWLERLMLIVVYLGIFMLYLGLKRSYTNFNAERIYGDTVTYVQTAQEPLSSRAFWLSDRTFTLPLLYKISGIEPDNFTEIPVMRKTANYQTWISAFSWAVLGMAVISSLRKKWLGPMAFALILFFSPGLEISLWDRLMYSGSLSFSLFALLIALSLITILFSFTRDSNLYLVGSGALVFGLAVVLKRIPVSFRKYYLIYGIFALGLFIYQNLTVNFGNRWQVHIYDNLVRRILSDEEGLNYFQQAGLPVSQALLDLGSVGVAEYQGLLMHSEEPEYKSVRDWVNESGQSTYVRYLLEHPQKSLLIPMLSFGKLINGSNREYRYPIFPGQPVPEIIELNDQKVYFRNPTGLLLLALFIMLGIIAYWLGKDLSNHAAESATRGVG